MDRIYFETLKSLDISEVTDAIMSDLRNEYDYRPLHEQSIITAFVLMCTAQDSSIDITNFETFKQSISLPLNVMNAIERNADSIWKAVVDLQGRFTIDQLLAYILFYDYEEGSGNFCSITPPGIAKLANKLLDIQAGEEVLELCSGEGRFFVTAFENVPDIRYKGIELNYTCVIISTIRAYALNSNAEFELMDALEYNAIQKADKLFSNYPFGYRSQEMEGCRQYLQTALGISTDAIKRASSDWLFNALLVAHMQDNGKAVAIMSNGSTWNTNDRKIRQVFIENGLIEAIIALPKNIFEGTSIAASIVVFSKNNQNIRLIDAQGFGTTKQRKTYIEDKHIAQICDLMNIDSEISFTKSISSFAANEYILNLDRYRNTLPEIQNGVSFGTIIKTVTRGAQLKADDLDNMKSSSETAFCYLTPANINDGTMKVGEDQYLREIPEKLEKYCVHDKSIVITKIGSPYFKTAIAQIDNDREVMANGNLYVIEIDNTKADPFYIQAVLLSDLGAAILNDAARGTTIRTLPLDNLKNMQIPLPDIKTQREMGKKYAAAMDELVLTQRKLERITDRMRHVFENGEVK